MNLLNKLKERQQWTQQFKWKLPGISAGKNEAGSNVMKEQEANRPVPFDETVKEEQIKGNREQKIETEPATAALLETESVVNSTDAAAAKSSNLIVKNDNDFAGLYSDTMVLFKYALEIGKKIPENINALLLSRTEESTISAYRELATIIKPAIPKSVVYLESQRQHRNLFFSMSIVPAVLHFMLVGLIAFVVLIVTSCSPLVSEANLDKGLLESSGEVLLTNLLFLSSVSCLGAIFSLLPALIWHIRNAVYLPEHNLQYWSRLLLGILGGMITGELLELNYDIKEASVEIDSIVFSLLGGFAAESVFLILRTVMSKIQLLIAGDTKESIY